MTSHSGNTASIQHNNTINQIKKCLINDMRDNERRATSTEFTKRFVDQVFTFRINRGRGFIENEY